MKTRISVANPFGRSFRLDHAFTWEVVSDLMQVNRELRVLDYGAHDGQMLRTCLDSGLSLQAFGVDANKSAIQRGKNLVSSGSNLKLGDVSELDQFAEKSGGFDVVCLIGVLEHINDQVGLLGRLRATLRPGGTFVISVPGKHFLSWLDFGNWKFYFPRLHKFFITRTKGEAYYRAKFVECQNGLFGDIEVGKREHQHFKTSELVTLLESCGFKVETIDGYGFFYRLLHNIWWPSPLFLRRALKPIILADLRIGGRAELVARARRV